MGEFLVVDKKWINGSMTIQYNISRGECQEEICQVVSWQVYA